MRPAKVPGEVVERMVWESLCERMDPKTHLVRPSWLTMMRKIHVCRQRIADAINILKAEGKIKVVEVHEPRRNGTILVFYYEVCGIGGGGTSREGCE